MVTEESAKETVKTIAQGMPAVAVYPWLLTPVLFAAQAASGATRIRHSLRPLIREGGTKGQNPRETCGGIAKLCLRMAGCLTNEVGHWAEVVCRLLFSLAPLFAGLRRAMLALEGSG